MAKKRTLRSSSRKRSKKPALHGMFWKTGVPTDLLGPGATMVAVGEPFRLDDGAWPMIRLGRRAALYVRLGTALLVARKEALPPGTEPLQVLALAIVLGLRRTTGWPR
jgi:hypothetical protein